MPERKPAPGVVVLHAWWGLNDFMCRVCDRLADAGFVAYAPDLYRGETARTVKEARRLRSLLDQSAATEEARQAVRYLRGQSFVRGEALAAVGFSLGARFALSLLEEGEEMAAIVLFYGSGGEAVQRTRAAVQGHFAETDHWGPEPTEIRALEQRIREAGGATDFHVYPGTQHWFFERDRADAYHESAAEGAWERSINFLRAHLEIGRGADAE